VVGDKSPITLSAPEKANFVNWHAISLYVQPMRSLVASPALKEDVCVHFSKLGHWWQQ